MFLPPFLCSLPRTVPVPALRPCLTCTAFSLPWYAHRRRKLCIIRFRGCPKTHSLRCGSSSHKVFDFAGALIDASGVTSPACIISGDGYSVVEVLFRICDRLFH